MKIQFNDEATTLFEYPSEASLLDEADDSEDDSEAGTPSPGLGNPFRCGNLASYTPSKLTLAADFELGVTRAGPPVSGAKDRGRDGAGENGEEAPKEEEECLRPADENTTVPWSAETAADLLF